MSGRTGLPQTTAPIRRLRWRPRADLAVEREWLVTNGLGGYSSGTIAGAITRRFHGLLVAALPAPLGRVMMLNYLSERIRHGTNRPTWLSAYGQDGTLAQAQGSGYLTEFRLEGGLPTWRYETPHGVIDRSLLMPFGQNSVHVTYRLLEGAGDARLTLRPLLGFRKHEAPLDAAAGQSYTVVAHDRRIEVRGEEDLPALRFVVDADGAAFTLDDSAVSDVRYLLEEQRGYDHTGALWSPGYFRIDLKPDRPITVVASTEPWETLAAISASEAARAERARRARLLEAADAAARSGPEAELVLAADQFIVRPVTRAADEVRARAGGGESRTVIAGYHWFTDWGRDTMIALEGLTLTTGRHAEARYILETFAHHVRDGLIPNLFPEGEHEGLYHTADATMWFFHAVARYEQCTGDEALVRELLPVLREIVTQHVAGTRFGIGVASDGLLTQGIDGYQLTWMDAKVDDWVVTPRRGKAVELNALWYNALCLLAAWLAREGEATEARRVSVRADEVRAEFNRRFWNPSAGHLFDVVDGEDGDDAACRPNQIFSVSLSHPVLHRDRWASVLEAVRTRLLTPRGLRSLAPGHPDYKPHYFGDLRTRDAAYHQGTVWSWLIGPFVDAWLASHPEDRAGARALLVPLLDHLDEACIGSVSEIFDGDPPFTPRGCIAQAWSVAELLRSLVRTGTSPDFMADGSTSTS